MKDGKESIKVAKEKNVYVEINVKEWDYYQHLKLYSWSAINMVSWNNHMVFQSEVSERKY